MPLQDYKELVGNVAAVVTIAQFFSPVSIVRKVIVQKSTKNVDPVPFIGGLGMGIVMLQHGLILNDMAMIPVNIFAFVLNLIYLSIFYKYHDDKSGLLMLLGKVLAGAAVMVGYAQIEQRIDAARLEFYYGLIVTLLMFALIGAPLFNLKEIIETKNTEMLPFPMIVSGAVVTFLWLLYGIILDNIFIKVQNVVGLLLCLVQLSLFVIFPSKPSADKLKKKE
ncbi:sugar transporter SWEET1 [Halyomorpha halys]|uniref:sugar transporter SWEET1 n=1 Tax=Halyomorpha halys TaxID=286706 RepID=UPI0006D4F844|nr:sugar transporter SWEET1-like [Halyomorpha halys]KAE8573075.1 hypothetical protein A483_HHAL011506 [Halyomorpha halys]